jgi:hypothetical protein
MQQDEYSAIEPMTETVVFANGTTVKISPMTISQIAKVGRALRDQNLLLSVRGLFGGGEIDAFDAIPFILEHADKLIDSVAIGGDVAKEDVAALLPDDFIALAGAVFVVNSDFFVRRLVPALVKASAGAGQVGAAAATAKAISNEMRGRNRSDISSPAVTV